MQTQTDNYLYLRKGGKTPLPQRFISIIVTEQQGRIANFLALAQQELYKLLEVPGCNFNPINFHDHYPYDFADEFYNCFKRLATRPHIPMSVNRIHSFVQLIVDLVSINSVERIIQLVKRQRNNAVGDPLHLSQYAAKVTGDASDTRKTSLRMLIRHEKFKEDSITKLPELTGLYKVQDVANQDAEPRHINKSLAGDLVQQYIYEVAPSIQYQSPEYKLLKHRLRKWFMEGRCLIQLLHGKEHSLPPALLLLIRGDRA